MMKRASKATKALRVGGIAAATMVGIVGFSAPANAAATSTVTVQDSVVHISAGEVPTADQWGIDRSALTAVVFDDPSSTSLPSNSTHMFSDMPVLTKIQGIDHVDTSNVTSLASAFYGTPGLTSLDLSGWDTSNVTNLNNTFAYAGLTSLDVSDWDTSSVTDMSGAFLYASGLTSLDVSSWNTSNVTLMNNVFTFNSGLTSLDLSGWDTGNVTNMASMFFETSALADVTLGTNTRLTEDAGMPTPVEGLWAQLEGSARTADHTWHGNGDDLMAYTNDVDFLGGKFVADAMIVLLNPVDGSQVSVENQVLSGVGLPGSSFVVNVNGVEAGAGVVANDGTWSVTVSTMPEGPVNLTATVTPADATYSGEYELGSFLATADAGEGSPIVDPLVAAGSLSLLASAGVLIWSRRRAGSLL